MPEEKIPAAGQENSDPNTMRVPIIFRVPQRMPTLYAHHMTVQKTEDEYILSFYEVVPPIVAPEDKETQELLRVKGIDAQCVARITVSKGRYPEFARLMSSMVEPNPSEVGQEQIGQKDS